MPVFDTAAAVRGSIGRNTYLEGKAMRANTEYQQAATDLTNKQVETYDQKLAMDQQDADTKSGTLRLKMQEFFENASTKETENLRNASAAALANFEETGDPAAATEAMIGSLDASTPGTRDEVAKRFGELSFDPDTANAVVMTADEFLMRGREKNKKELQVLLDQRADPNTRPEDIPDIEARIAKLTAITGTTEFDPSASGVNKSGVSRNTIDFQESAIGAVGAVQMGTDLMMASATNPEALGVPGGFMRWGSNFVSGANAIADWASYKNVSPEDKELQTMGAGAFDYGGLDIEKLGVSGAEAEKFRAGVYGIAFAAAVAEQGTRPTDKDIQQFIDQIGGRATSAQSFRETIFQFMRRQDRRLKTIADVKNISPVDREAAFSSWTPSFNKFVEAYANTTGRKTATNAETGQRFIEMTPGNWEEF